jgi:hypothetical protein
MRHPHRNEPLAPLPPPILALVGLLVLLALVPAVARAAGPEIDYGTPPAGAQAWVRACSLRHPACVHGAPGTSAGTVLAALDAIDRSWDVQTQALDLPQPDGDAGGAWDAYLVDAVVEGGRARLASRDPRGATDRGASFALIDRAAPPGCPLDVAAARAVAWGGLLRAVPATDVGTARAQTRMLARLASTCAGTDEDERAFQAEPETSVVDPTREAPSSGASLFFDWLEQSFAGQPGALVAGMWALAPTRTPPGDWRWAGKPTWFDVLASSLTGALGTDSDMDDVLLHFGIDRGLTPPPARVAWHVPWPARARRLASPIAVAPTGASYVMIDRAGAPPGASLRVESTWEDYGRMKWAVIKLDAAGHALAVLPMTSPRLATSAALTVELVDAVDRFLVVGVNVGSTEHPFDPGQGWWEPHGWVLAISPG